MNFEFLNDLGGLKELPFLTIDAAFYGIQSFIVAGFAICQICDQLAEKYFQHGCLEKCNDFIIENFNAFKANLIDEGHAGDFCERIQTDDADLYLIERLGKLITRALEVPVVRKQNALVDLLESRLSALKQIDEFIQGVSLPILPEQPQDVIKTLNFDESDIKTPFGLWQRCARVFYAVQYENAAGKVSKIGPWSEACTIYDKACPILQVPTAELGIIRLIYRKFEDTAPLLVGRLVDSKETLLHDVNHELYELAGDIDARDVKNKCCQLLKSGASLNVAFENGRTALHAAAAAGNTYIMPHLLLSGDFVDLDLKDANGYPSLHIAAAAGHEDFVALLLKLNVDKNAQTASKGLTALHVAAARGHVAVLANLLTQYEVDINKMDFEGYSALHYAALKAPELVAALLENKNIEINAISNFGLTALHVAVITQNYEIAAILLKSQQIDVNLQCCGKFSALHFAVLTKNAGIFQLLLQHNTIDLNLPALNGFTALHYAVLLRAVDFLKQLLSLESIDVKAKTAGELTALHMAVILDEKHILNALLKAGAEIDARSRQAGFTALHLAAKFGRESSLRPLIQHGADLNLKTFDGLTPLALATYNDTSRLACFRLLIESGATIS